MKKKQQIVTLKDLEPNTHRDFSFRKMTQTIHRLSKMVGDLVFQEMKVSLSDFIWSEAKPQ